MRKRDVEHHIRHKNSPDICEELLKGKCGKNESVGPSKRHGHKEFHTYAQNLLHDPPLDVPDTMEDRVGDWR